MLFSLKGDQTYTYEGDRTRDDIVAFAQRLLGPPIKKITNHKELTNALQAREINFAYIGHPNGDLWVRNAELNINKTGVINDPLGQTHSHASSEHCFLLF